ncbi:MULTISPECIES: response regulator transcription factor [unclassified Cupriavidus]|uniref:response regulator transcription factor n=1 Tax=unclassified Cupriavidus TaxID=2640874 RepID=UPI001FB7E5E0|nr:response regulator transcription factor [Cupriavidus sp. L7L]
MIADDHPVVLAGLVPYLERHGIAVIAVANSAAGLLAVLKHHASQPPEIIITGYDYGGEADGMRLVERIRRMSPQARIVVFWGGRSNGVVRQLLARGADAFVAKSTDLQCMADACRAVLSGEKYLDPATQALLAGSSSQDAEPSADRLTPREQEVIRLLGRGLPLQDIARQFNRSVKTISVQKCSAMNKLGLRNEIELALYLVMQAGR